MAASTSEMDEKSEKKAEKSNISLDLLNEDELFENLKRTPYTDGWPEDKWREEIEKHPFFMSEAPDPSKELPPLIEGLQQLKYSETENTPDELSKTYKDDGNFYFKCKKYRDAISHYTAGLKQDCSSVLKAQLFNNRSAANFFIQNFKTALNDCEETLKLDSNYKKAKFRKAQCLYHLETYDQCIETCDDIITSEGANSDLIKLKKDAVEKKKLKDRNSRKDRKKEQSKNEEEKLIMLYIKERKINIRLAGNKKFLKLSDLDPDPHLPARLDRVHLKDNKLFWPVVYNFPELTLNMPINEFDENRTFSQLLCVISEGMTEYDPEGKFTHQNTRIFYRDVDEKLVEFNIRYTLRTIMSSPKFVLTAGIVLFSLLLRDNEFTKEYLQRTESSLLLE